MKRTTVTIATLITPLLLLASAHASESWKQVSSEQGIETFVRTAERSAISELKAVIVIDAGLESITQVLRDVDAYPQWMPRCKKVRLIRKFDDHNRIVHIVLRFPFPTSDRDLVVKAATTFDPSGTRAVVSLELVNESIPIARGIVRMTEFSGEYVLESLSGNRTLVSYRNKVNPGGFIPTSMVNLFSQEIIRDSLRGLRAMTIKNKYVAAAPR